MDKIDTNFQRISRFPNYICTSLNAHKIINVLISTPPNLQIEKDKWKLHQNSYKQKLQPIDGQQTKKRYTKLLEIWIKSTPNSNEFQHFQTT